MGSNVEVDGGPMACYQLGKLYYLRTNGADMTSLDQSDE
jgi:hypothetical protein